MRIGILSSKQQLQDTPYRHVPKRVVKFFVAEGKIEMLSKQLGKELCRIPSSEYERLLHPGMVIIEKLLPPTQPTNLDLYYPNPRYFVANCGLLHDPSEA